MRDSHLLILLMARVGGPANDRFLAWITAHRTGNPSMSDADFVRDVWDWVYDDPDWSAAAATVFAEVLS